MFLVKKFFISKKIFTKTVQENILLAPIKNISSKFQKIARFLKFQNKLVLNIKIIRHENVVKKKAVTSGGFELAFHVNRKQLEHDQKNYFWKCVSLQILLFKGPTFAMCAKEITI